MSYTKILDKGQSIMLLAKALTGLSPILYTAAHPVGRASAQAVQATGGWLSQRYSALPQDQFAYALGAVGIG